MKTVYEQKFLCCGCTACQHICPQNAISMIEDDQGFKYPQIDFLRCTNCGLCKKVCPLVTLKKPATPHYQVFAARHRNRDVLERSSSGGMFTAFSDYVLDKGGMVYGSCYNKDFKLMHQCAVDRESRNSLCGSKYVQSDLNDCFDQIKKNLTNGRDVCFVGTPCQCAGLQSFLINTDTSQLLTIALICHGVPSPKLFDEYLKYCNKKRKAKIIEYEHRPKHRYWGHIERARFIYDNGDSDSDSDSVLSQGWKWLFYSNAALRPCCYECHWAKNGHTADVTLGDYWGIEDSIPDFYDKMGVSAVLINTKKGQCVFREISDAVEFRSSNFEDVIRKNPNLTAPSIPLTDKEKFWEIYGQKGFSELMVRYGHINSYYRLKNIVRRLVYKMRLLR